MQFILTAIIVLGGLLDLFIGIGFLINPVSQGVGFGLEASGVEGVSAIRADMTAFFVVTAGSMLLGAWKRRGDWLVPALALMVIAFTGRLVNLVVMGGYDGWWIPMTIELAHIVVLGLAIRVLPWGRSGIA